MHHTIRLALASGISAIVGWLLILIGNELYALFTGGQSPVGLDTFTSINWSISTILSAIVFVIAYIKITNWLEG